MKVTIEPNPENRLNSGQLKVRAGQGFVYHKSSQPFYKIKLLITNMVTNPEIYVNRIEHYIYNIPKLINLLEVIDQLVNHNIIKIHAAAVAKPGTQEGIILSAWSDVGKTTITYLLARQKYLILGDDQINLSVDGTIHRIDNAARLFPHPSNLKPLDLTLKQRLLGWFKFNFWRIPAFYRIMNPDLEISYDKIGTKIDTAKVNKIFIMEKGEPEIQRITKEEAINKIITTSLRLWIPNGFPKNIFYHYCFANNLRPTFIADRAYSILNTVLEGKEVIILKGKTPFDFHNLFIKHESR